MRLYTLALLCVLSCSSAGLSAQAQPSSVATDNLYSKALFASVEEMDRRWGAIDDSANRIRTDYHNMIVEQDDVITDSLPKQIGDYRVEYLDRPQLIARYKRLKKPFAILHIFPVKNEGPVLWVHVAVFWFSSKGRGGYFALSDWSDVRFRFDCEKQAFVISDVTLGGI